MQAAQSESLELELLELPLLRDGLRFLRSFRFGERDLDRSRPPPRRSRSSRRPRSPRRSRSPRPPRSPRGLGDRRLPRDDRWGLLDLDRSRRAGSSRLPRALSPSSCFFSAEAAAGDLTGALALASCFFSAEAAAGDLTGALALSSGPGDGVAGPLAESDLAFFVLGCLSSSESLPLLPLLLLLLLLLLRLRLRPDDRTGGGGMK